jgi:hypothetical protein
VVVRTQAGYAFVDERRKRTGEVTKGDDKHAHVEDQVREVATSVSTQEKHNIKKAVTFGKTPAKNTGDPTEKKSSKPHKKQIPALASGDYEVLGSSQLDYTVLARQERDMGELTLRLLP